MDIAVCGELEHSWFNHAVTTPARCLCIVLTLTAICGNILLICALGQVVIYPRNVRLVLCNISVAAILNACLVGIRMIVELGLSSVRYSDAYTCALRELPGALCNIVIFQSIIVLGLERLVATRNYGQRQTSDNESLLISSSSSAVTSLQAKTDDSLTDLELEPATATNVRAKRRQACLMPIILVALWVTSALQQGLAFANMPAAALNRTVCYCINIFTYDPPIVYTSAALFLTAELMIVCVYAYVLKLNRAKLQTCFRFCTSGSGRHGNEAIYSPAQWVEIQRNIHITITLFPSVLLHGVCWILLVTIAAAAVAQFSTNERLHYAVVAPLLYVIGMLHLSVHPVICFWRSTAIRNGFAKVGIIRAYSCGRSKKSPTAPDRVVHRSRNSLVKLQLQN